LIFNKKYRLNLDHVSIDE